MSHTPPVSPPQTLFLALMAGFGAALLALLAGWFYFVFMVEVSAVGTLGADSDTMLVAAFVTLTAAPVLAWLLLRLLGLPHPLLSALLSVPLYLVYVAVALTESLITQDPLWSRALGLVAMSLAVALPALATSHHHRRAVQRDGAVPKAP